MVRKFRSAGAWLLLAVGLLPSCKKNDPLVFSDNGLCVFQQETGFTPYARFSVASGSLEGGSVMHDGKPVEGRLVGTNAFETTAAPAASLEELDGRYVLTASGNGNSSVESVVWMKNDKPLGAMNVPEFAYRDGRIFVTIDNVENATAYGILLNPVVEGIPSDSRIFARYMDFLPVPNKDRQSIVIDYPSRELEYEAVRIAPMAMRARGTGTLILAGEGRTLRKGATAFEKN